MTHKEAVAKMKKMIRAYDTDFIKTCISEAEAKTQDDSVKLTTACLYDVLYERGVIDYDEDDVMFWVK